MTKEDYLILRDEILKSKDSQRASALIERLKGIQRTKTSLFLKPGVVKPPEELSPDDFEPRVDPALEFWALGFTDEEIDGIIRELEEVRNA